MLRFHDLSLKNKLTAIILLTAGLMILFISTLFMINEAVTFRRGALHNIRALAGVTAINSSAALSFEDPHTARELLQAMRAAPHIVAAAIYTAAGERFAVYSPDPEVRLPRHINPDRLLGEKRQYAVLSAPDNREWMLIPEFLDAVQAVMLNSKRIGVVFIRSDMKWIFRRMKLFIAIGSLVMAGLIALSYFISARLQRIVSVPIEVLAKTMQRVTRERDYPARVQCDRNDELGTLMEGFNTMLEQIQERDKKLEKSRKQLKRQVQLRTQALEISETQKKKLLVQQRIQEAYGRLVSQMNSIDTSAIMEKSLCQIAGQADALWAAVYFWDDKRKDLTLKKTFLAERIDIQSGETQSATRWLNREMVAFAKRIRCQKGHLFQQWKRHPFGAYAALLSISAYPLCFQNRRIGVLTLATVERPDQDVAAFLQNSTRQLGVAIHNALTFEDLQQKTAQLKKSNLELERISKMKSDFLANMSHELRTPLNAIIGFSELLIDQHFGVLNDSQQGYLRDILESGRHLLSLINDILDLSKVEAGKMRLDRQDVCIEALLQSSLTMIRQKAQKHRIALSIHIDNMPPRIQADERKLKQVLYNLVSNAIKFTEDGGSIDIRAATVSSTWLAKNMPFPDVIDYLSSHNGSCTKFLKVSVSDSGIGIEPKNIDKIFNAFEQVDTSISKKYQGTGLGLALCKRFLALHGGTIWAESEFGKGSTFTFIIPLNTTGSIDDGENGLEHTDP